MSNEHVNKLQAQRRESEARRRVPEDVLRLAQLRLAGGAAFIVSRIQIIQILIILSLGKHIFFKGISFENEQQGGGVRGGGWYR